ncbi:MAG: hypothetical protein ACLS37_11120 [Alistipes sp.]
MLRQRYEERLRRGMQHKIISRVTIKPGEVSASPSAPTGTACRPRAVRLRPDHQVSKSMKLAKQRAKEAAGDAERIITVKSALT